MNAQKLHIPAAEYHAEQRISNSKLSDFIRSPAWFHGLYMTCEFTKPQSDAMSFGTLAHAVLLEGLRFVKTPDFGLDAEAMAATEAVQIPDELLTKGRNRAKNTRSKDWPAFEAEAAGRCMLKPDDYAAWCRYRHFLADHDGATAVSEKDYAALTGILRNVQADAAARALLFSGGETEVSIYWDDVLPMKARIDRLYSNVIVDLKTTQDARPASFSSSAAKYGYHRQQILYQAAVEALTGEELPFRFVVVESEPPYSVAVVKLSNSFVEIGRRQVMTALDDLSRRMESDDWGPETRGQEIEIDAPGWLASMAWELS